MGTYWAPRPRRAIIEANGLFDYVESETVVKGLSPIEQQRKNDGTPYTFGTPSALRPPDPVLVIKGSLVEKFPAKPVTPKEDPQDPISVVKSYLAHNPNQKEDTAKKEKMDKSLKSMKSAIQDLVTKTGAK